MASEFCGQPEIEAYRFRMPYMQITIRLGRKTGDDFAAILAGIHILGNDGTNEIRRRGEACIPRLRCFHDFYLAFMMNYSIAVRASNPPRVCTNHRAYFTI